MDPATFFLDDPDLSTLPFVDVDEHMVWVESPSNPILKVTDIPKLVRAVRNVKDDIIIVMDNTFLGPFFQKGLKLGADVVVYSLSKYMNGHADVILGAAITNHKTIHDYLTSRQQFGGMIPSPFDCFQVMRGLKTHPVRMLQHWKNALRIAKWLVKNPYVELVHYPGLRSQSKLPRRMWSGMSGMLSFKLKNFNQNMTRDFLGELRYFRVAWSLGAVESLAEQPYVMLDMSFPEAVRAKLGVTPNLVRLSVGLEYYQDLIDDLDQAMRTIAPEGPPFDLNEYATQDPYDIPGYYREARTKNRSPNSYFSKISKHSPKRPVKKLIPDNWRRITNTTAFDPDLEDPHFIQISKTSLKRRVKKLIPDNWRHNTNTTAFDSDAEEDY